MPPKTRGSNTLKASKENVGVIGKNKTTNKSKKPQRKVLADKTNSASDDENLSTNKQQIKASESNDIKRSRREKKIPKRYIGNEVLTNLSKSNSIQDLPTSPVKSRTKKILTKNKTTIKTPLKITSKALDNSILKSRPKRVCRLPAKLEGHSISSNKLTSLQPVGSSTPVAVKTTEHTTVKFSNSLVETPSPVTKSVKSHLNPKVIKKFKTNSDSNNNGKKQQKIDKCFETQVSSGKFKNKPLDKSIKIVYDSKRSLKRNSSKIDPYEFTFDPNEEPPPQKRKKKRVIKTKEPKPKKVVKNTYEKNLAKVLATLKNVVTNAQVIKDVQVATSKPNKSIKINNHEKCLMEVSEKGYPDTCTLNEESNNIPCTNNYNSVRIEDIALDLQEPDHTIDYSPVNSPHHTTPKVVTEEIQQAIDKDSFSLRDDISFFDDHPVASSSMNTSIRHPLASPWRVEFGSLPIKWPVNTYVKPNMTPAVESSFIAFHDTKKKHVYTNIVPIYDQPPQDTSLKQTSILSFMKEVAERSVKKKMKSTPIKANSLFEDITNTSINVSPIKSITQNNSKDVSKSSNSDHIDEEVESSVSISPEKKKSSKNGTLFGFDDTVDENQENISPVQKDKRRGLRPHSRVVLRDIDNGPFRAHIPISKDPKAVPNWDNLNNDFEDPKTGLEPPQFPDQEITQTNDKRTNVNLDDDSQSPHLFEDLDAIHHYREPPRKNYGKGKKVVFRNNSDTDSDVTDNDEQDSSDYENLDDLSFKLPSVKPKRKNKKMTKKQKISKKEEQEVENWAAGFNSMCADVEEFDLIVE